MNPTIQTQFEALDFSNVPVPELYDRIYERVEDIISKSKLESEEIIDALPEKIRAVYLLVELSETMLCDGFFSVFYNFSYRHINQIQIGLAVIGFPSLSKCFNEGLELTKKKFHWKDENTNFVTQMRNEGVDVDPGEYFGERIANRMESLEEKIQTIFDSDEFCCHIDKFWLSR